MKKNLYRCLLFSSFVSLLSPNFVFAEEKNYFGYSKDEWKEFANGAFDTLEKVEKKIDEHVVDPAKEKLSEIPIYAQDSLWLITDMPTENPNEARHYYFIDKNTPSIKQTLYFDQNFKRVSKNDSTVCYKKEKEMFVSLTNLEEVFLIESWYDFQTFTFSVNYVDFDQEQIYDSHTSYRYGRFQNISDLIPLSYQKEKYSTKDLQEILKILNDLDYQISVGVTLQRSKHE